MPPQPAGRDEQRSPHRFRLLRFKPGDEHARLTGIAKGQADTGDLICSLAGSVDHLASARAPRAIGVDFREAQVQVSLVGKASLGIDWAYRARRHLLEHMQDLLRFHKPAPFPSAKRGPSLIPLHSATRSCLQVKRHRKAARFRHKRIAKGRQPVSRHA